MRGVGGTSEQRPRGQTRRARVTARGSAHALGPGEAAGGFCLYPSSREQPHVPGKACDALNGMLCHIGPGDALAPQPPISFPSATLDLLKPPMHYASISSSGHAQADGIPRAQTWASDIISSTRTTAAAGSPLRGTASAMTWEPGAGGRPMTAGARKPESLASVKLA